MLPPTPDERVPDERAVGRQYGVIRPFRVHMPEEALVDLRRRIAATRWPDRESVHNQSQGVKLAQMQSLIHYWQSAYDWRKVEAKLNALPQFVTEIDGLDIYFIHVRSRHPHALPLLITHGWPGSILEFVKVIKPLTNPTDYGGSAEDAFDLVLPSLPGFGFSERPMGSGWGSDQIARTWDHLMQRLGYDHYVAQGGGWGAVITGVMGRQAPAGLLGIHVNMPAAVPDEVATALKNGDAAPAGLSTQEQVAFAALRKLTTKAGGYAAMMSTRPQTLGYALADSPVALAAFFLDKFNEWTYSDGNAERSLAQDEMLDDITLYWLTNTGTSSARLYWEDHNHHLYAREQRSAEISVPVAITVFPGEIYQAPRRWAEAAYPTLTYFNEVERGGHFAAWEEPELFAEEMRKSFKPLRGSTEAGTERRRQ